MSSFAAVIRKDLKLEARGGHSTLALLAMSMMVLVVLVFALDAARVRSADTAAGALWVAMVFSGLVGATRALGAERENNAIRGLLLSPLDPATLYAAKLVAAFIFMAVAEIGAVILMVLFLIVIFSVSKTTGRSCRLVAFCENRRRECNEGATGNLRKINETTIKEASKILLLQ